ncbi:MAG: VWA domain-containing protein [Planctomycetota bacterium]
MPFRFDHPELLWLLLLAGPIGWLGAKRLAAVEPVRRWLAIGLRIAVLVGLVLMLAGLRAERRHTDLTVIAVIDQSPSMRIFGSPLTADGTSTAASARVTASVQRFLTAAAQERRPDDRFGVVTYDDRPTVLRRPGNDVAFDTAVDHPTREGTDTARALEWAMAVKSDANTALRLVLVSDGNDTAGDTLAAARAAAAAGVVIDVLPIGYRVGHEVMVEGVYTPTEAREGQTVAVRVVLRATAPSRGTLQLRHDDRLIDLNGSAEGRGLRVTPDQWSDANTLTDEDTTPGSPGGVASGRYVWTQQIDVPISVAGANRFEAIFEPTATPSLGTTNVSPGDASANSRGGLSGADTVAVNNRAESFTLVQGQGRVLVVDNVGGAPGKVLPEALRQRRIALDVVPPSGLPRDTAALTRYDAVVFQNVPAEAVTGAQQEMLARYVNDLGGGFIMLGGPDSFGAGGWTNSIIDERILPVDCEIPSQTVLPSGALVIVIDRSGSMGAPVGNTNQTQLEFAAEAAALAISTLYPHDMIGVVAFDGAGQWVYKLQKNDNPNAAMQTVRSIREGGGTSILSGLTRAYEGLTDPSNQDLRDSSIKHVILLSDGGDSDNYLPMLNQLNRADITVSTIGVGDGHDAQLLERIALQCGGNYYPIDPSQPNGLPQVFVKEARTIRKNLIREVDFVPKRRNTGSPIMVNLPEPPALSGLVLTGPKYDRRIEMPMLGPEGEPLFAHWQVGLGKAGAWTSDATNRWATRWLTWPGYGDFWARTVRYLSRPAANQDAELITTLDGDTLRVRLDTNTVGGADGGAVTRVAGKILRPDGSLADITLDQTGPGIFTAAVPAPQSGNYLLNLFVGGGGDAASEGASGGSSGGGSGGGGATSFVAGGITRVPGQELRRFAPNTTLLEEVAAATGGRVLDPDDPVAANLFDRTHRFESVSSRPLRWLILPWLLGLLLLDVANRRLAWDHRAIAAWTRSALTVQRRSASETKQTMSALKRRRGAVKSGHGETPAAPQPVTTQKFDAAPDRRASDNFADAVGGAKETQGDADLVAAAQADTPPPEDAPTTNRLLAAKRRARERNQ